MKFETLTIIWKIKFVKPLRGFLKQGLDKKKLALCLALGVTLGTFPVLGVTTGLCALAALAFKLNMPIIQFANYAVYPLQVILLIPFYYFGDLLFNARRSIDFDTLRTTLTENNYWEVFIMTLDTTAHAVVAWLFISPLLLVLLYSVLKPVMARLNARSSRLKLTRR